MSIKDDLKLRLSEEITFNGDGYDIMCGVIDDFFESKLPSHNKKSAKSICKHCSNPDCTNVIHGSVGIVTACGGYK